MTIGTLISKGEIKISDTCKYISDMKENNTTNNYKIRALITIEVQQWTFCYTVFITQLFQKNPPTPPSSPNPWSPAAAVKTLLLAHGPNYLSVSLASPESCGEPCAGFVWSRTPYWHPLLRPPPSVCVLSHSSLHSRSLGRHRVLSLTLRCFAVVLTPLHYLTLIRAEETQF